MKPKHIFFAAFSLGLYGLFFILLKQTPQNDLTHHTFTHLPLIPFISAFFLLFDRKAIFSETGNSYRAGIAAALGGITGLIVSSG
ncbi:MAG: hypothetical protein GF350_02985, partial [Chitinivibrionales bacterium]|nr:hypothetical protein [Chitinivibrionales bacterium]